MAPSPKLISFFFLLTLFSMQTYARESQFFSKVSGTTTTANPTTTTTTTTINSKGNTFPKKEEENFKKQEEEPTFMQETQNGYGLYGQESNTQFPTTTKLVNQPYTTTTYNPYNTQTQTQSQKTYTNYPNTNSNYYNNNQYTNDEFDQEQQRQQNFGETSLQENSYTTTTNQNNNNKYYTYNGGNGYKQGRQGMSDTRYMENGKYSYDIESEKNSYPNQYQNPNSRNSNYDTRAYSNYDNNNENAYGYNKYSMESQQEDFQDSHDEQYVP